MLAGVWIALSVLMASQEAVPQPESEPPASLEAPAAPAVSTSRLETLRHFVDGIAAAYLAEHDIPGLVVSVVLDGEVLTAGYGMADAEAGLAASGDGVRVEIGSISKTFVWTAIMMLEAEGALDLHADINTYLSGHAFGGNDGPITLAQLMSHRPGLEDTYAVFLSRFAEMDLADALVASEPPAMLGRGEAPSYSNWGSTLAALVVEEVSGLSYRDFLYQRILTPLGMNDTTYQEADRMPDQPPLTPSYKREGGVMVPVAPVDIGAFGPSGSMASTAADMARWMQFHLNGGELDGVRLMPADTHARMLTRLYDDASEGADLAHGFMNRPLRGLDVYGHGGAIQQFLANMEIMPEIGAGVFMTQNANISPAPYRFMPDLILSRLLDEAGIAPLAHDMPEDAAARAGEVEGRYLTNRRSLRGIEKLFGGLAVINIAAREDGTLLLAPSNNPGRAVVLRPVGPDVYEDRHGGRVVFQRDGQGRVFRMLDPVGAHSLDRLRLIDDANLLIFAAIVAAFFSVTAWLGLWRRVGRPGPSPTPLGRALSIGWLATALITLGFLVLFMMALGTLGSAGMEVFLGSYPPAPLPLAMAVAGLVTVLGVLAILSLVPAFALSGWTVWRTLHFALFALSLAGFGGLLAVWGVAFGGHAGS